MCFDTMPFSGGAGELSGSEIADFIHHLIRDRSYATDPAYLFDDKGWHSESECSRGR
mgnify:CR=1 FL=1